MDVDPLTAPWSTDQTAVMRLLHDWAVSFVELNQHLAVWTGLPSSDANALSHIVWAAEEGQPLSPADLSRRIGLSSGATTALLNRLETAGHIRRSREHADRRRVTVRPRPGTREQTRAFLAVAGAEIAEVLSAADPDDVRRTGVFLTAVNAAATRANHRLRRHRSPGRTGDHRERFSADGV